MNTQDILIGAVVVQATAFIGKIVWDDYKKKGTIFPEYCNGCLKLSGRIEKQETCIMNLKQTSTQHDTLIEEHYATTRASIREIYEIVKESGKTMGEVKENIAVLLDRSKQRRQSD